MRKKHRILRFTGAALLAMLVFGNPLAAAADTGAADPDGYAMSESGDSDVREAVPGTGGSGRMDERMTNADFPTQLRPEPDSFRSLAKIPPATKIKILDMRVIQMERFKENWYRVEYEGTSGWVRGDDLDGESSEKQLSVTYQAPDLPGTSVGGVSF